MHQQMMVLFEQHRELQQRKQHRQSDSVNHTSNPGKPNQENANREEGFTRSISLYWLWARGQKAAARVGKGLLHNSSALILQCEHWLEAADPKHRYGTNLRPYFDYWLTQQAKACDAAATKDSCISYSAIPEIAAQAAAAAEANSGQMHISSAAAADDQGDCSAQCQPVCSKPAVNFTAACTSADVLPATRRRSRSAPDLAELHAASPEVVAAAECGSADADADVVSHADAAATPCDRSSNTIVAADDATHSSSKPYQHRHSLSDMTAVAAAAAAGGLGGPPPLPGIHTDDRFFYWLDEGAGRHVDLFDRGVPRGKLESERVQYLTEAERNQLEVTVDSSTGLLLYKVSGQTVHTGSELSLVPLKPMAASSAHAAANPVPLAAAAAATAALTGESAASGAESSMVLQPGTHGRTLSLIPEDPAAEQCEQSEEEDPEPEHQQQDGQQDAADEQQQQGWQQQKRQRWQQQQQRQAALQQLQDSLRQQQPLQTDQQLWQQQQQHLQQHHVQEQQQQQHSHQPHDATAAKLNMLRRDTDTVMVDADATDVADVEAAGDTAAEAAEGSAVCFTPIRHSSSSTTTPPAAAAMPAVTPTAAAYGAVAGLATPGTTCISKCRPSVEPLTQQTSEYDIGTLHQQQEQQQQVAMGQRIWHGQQQQQGQQHNGVLNTCTGGGQVQIKEKPCKWIYVLDTSGRLFVHAKFRGKFHHSSFLQGGAVMSAGGIVVEHGRIVKLTADSGHYRPKFDSFMSTVQLLKDRGADLTKTKLSAKHIRCPQLPEV